MFLVRLYVLLRAARSLLGNGPLSDDLPARDPGDGPPRHAAARQQLEHGVSEDGPGRRVGGDRLLGQAITSLSQISNLTIALWGGTIAASIAAFASALPYMFEQQAHCWATAISGAALYVVQSSIGWLCILVILPSIFRTLAAAGSRRRGYALAAVWLVIVVTSIGVFIHVLENFRQFITFLPDRIPEGMSRAKCSTWMLDQSFHPRVSFSHSIRLLFYRGTGE